MKKCKSMSRGRPALGTIFLAAALLVLVTVAFTYWMRQVDQESTEKASRQRLVLNQLAQFTLAMKDVENAQRGYLLSGQEKYLEPYKKALAKVQERLIELHRLASKGELDSGPVEWIADCANKELAELAQTIQLRPNRARQPGGVSQLLEQNKRIMDSIRSQIAGLEEKEEAELEQAGRQVERAERLLTAAFILTALLNLLFFAWAYRRIRRDLAAVERAEETARASQEEFRLVSESASDGIVMHEEVTEASRGVFIRVNPAICQMLGYNEEEMRSLTPLDIIAPENLESVEREREAMEADGVLLHEKTLLTKDGRRFPAELNSRLFLHNGKRMVISIIRDISDRKRAEQALRVSEERYRSLFANMNEGFALHEIVCGVDGKPCDYRFLDINPAFESLTGLKREDVVGRTVCEVLPGNDPSWVERYGAVALSGKPVRFEDYSTPLQKHFEVFAYRPAAQQFAVIFMDVSERKQAEEALRESEKRLNRAQEIAHLGSWELDLVNGRLSWSDEVYRIFGLQPQEFGATYQAFLEAVHPDDRAAVDAAYSGSLREGRDSYEIEHRVVIKANGEVRIVHEKCEHTRDESGQIVRSTGMVHDITERRRAQEALLRSKEEWERTFDSVPDLITILDEDHHILRVNKAMAERIGRLPEECPGLTCYNHIHGMDHAPLSCPHVLTLADGRGHAAEIHEERLGGDFLVSTTPLDGPDGRRIGTVHIARDITERKKVEGELQKVNRTLRALFNSSQAMGRAEDESDYMEEVCRSIVEDCGHAMAWIGFAEYGEDKAVRPVASAGFEEGYFESLNITWADTERGRGPTGRAIRTGKPSLCRNMLTDPRFEPWREEAVKRGYASSISMPLLSENKAFGALTIYSREQDPFSVDEVKLLAELANDLAHGIASIRLRLAHARAEEAHRQSEERYRGLVELSPEAVFVNRGDRMVFMNAAALHLFGADNAEELLGRSPFDVFGLDCYAGVREPGGKPLEGRPAPAFEQKIVRLDGAVRDVEVSAALFVDSEGPAIQVILRDITERKAVEEALRKAKDDLERRVEERTAELSLSVQMLEEEVGRRARAEQSLQVSFIYTRGLIEANLDPLVTIGAEGKVTDVNKETERVTGLPRERLIGSDFSVYYTEPGRAREAYEIVLSDGQVRNYPLAICHVSGQTIDVLFNAIVYRDAEGRAQGVFAAAHDITDRKRTEQEMLRMNAALRQRTAQLRELASELTLAEERERRRIAAVLHDGLQQLLVSAKFRTGALQRSKNKKVQEMALAVEDLIVQSIDVSRSLTRDLTPPILYEAGLVPALEWLADWMEEKHGLVVVLNAAEEVPLETDDMKMLLFQSVRELLLNAVKHAEVEVARVEVSRLEDRVRIVVQDDGAGFDPELEGQERTGAKGFGLFSIRERLVLMGGQMNIESAPGKGVRVSLDVPLGAAQPSPQDESVSPARAGAEPREEGHEEVARAPLGGRRIRILLADDHDMVREGLAGLLDGEEDFDVVGQARNGQEAVELAGQLQPDVVLMDVSMPVMDGFQATERITESLPGIRVIALSMHDDPSTSARMIGAGASGYLCKSGPLEQLVDALRKQME